MLFNKQQYYDLLQQLDITYQVVDHESIDTMEGLKEVEELLNAPIAKNLMLCNRQETKFYLLLTVGNKKFKTKEISSQINSARLSFAKGEYMEKYLGCKPGSASVLGLVNDSLKQVSLLIDEEILNQEYLCAHPCDNTSTLKIPLSDIINLFLPYTHHNYQVVKLQGELL